MRKQLVAKLICSIVLFAVFVPTNWLDAGFSGHCSASSLQFTKVKKSSGYSWEENETEDESKQLDIAPAISSSFFIKISDKSLFRSDKHITFEQVPHSFQLRPLWLINRMLIL